MRRAERVELSVQRALGVEVFHDRLDHQIAVSQGVQLRGALEPAQRCRAVVVAELAFAHAVVQHLLDPLQAVVERCLVGFTHNGMEAGLSAHLRDSCAHQPTPDDSDLVDLH
jgi:hypothetical protein